MTKVARLRGNKAWQLRAKHGRDKIFADAELLMAHAEAYFRWCDSHPRYKTELVKYKGGYEEAEIPIGRPYTMDGLTVYLGVSGGYFRAAKSNIRTRIEAGKATEEDHRIMDTIEVIESIVRNEQIEGAMVGQYKESLTARINGIADNLNQTNTGDSIIRVTVRDAETEENLNALSDLL